MEAPAAAAGLPAGEITPSGALHLAVEDGDQPSPAVNQEATGLGAVAAAASAAAALKRQNATASSDSGTEGERDDDELTIAVMMLQIAEGPTLRYFLVPSFFPSGHRWKRRCG
jgi:hypothetical protein